jgi:hypothetical protein
MSQPRNIEHKECLCMIIPHSHYRCEISGLPKAKAVPSTHLRRRRGERRYSSYSFTTSALDRGEVISVTPRPCFTPRERTPGTYWTGGWVGPEPVWTQRLEESKAVPLHVMEALGGRGGIAATHSRPRH